MTKKPKIQVKNLTMQFGDLLVLDNINFDVQENAFLCVVGPTGCGKTTFCNLVTTLLEPTKGSIEIDGGKANPRKHNISFVFQEPSGLPWKTISDNIKYALQVKGGYSPQEMDNMVSDIIELVGMKGFEDFFPHQVSAGMKQRLAIARAFVTKPDLLLMDEPFGQLDLKTRFHMMDAVLKLWRTSGATIIYVTHNLEEAVYLAQDIMVLSQKPTYVKEMVPVSHLPHPRDYADPEFVRIREQVTDLVKWW